MPNFIDLHTHTTSSDGKLTPSELVRYAEECALSAVAITDHDTAVGVEEAKNASVGLDIEIVPGIELSAEYDAEMHILGLFIDPYAAVLQGAIQDMKLWRTERNEEMIGRLEALNIGISRQDILAKTHNGDMANVGRVHMALALIEKGLAKTPKESFTKYLSRSGEAYVARKRFSPEKCIEIIKASGGCAILAHPIYSVREKDKLEKLVKTLMGYGLDGIECYHSAQPDSYGEQCLKLCARYDLLVSGGSDFHGANKPNVQLGRAYDGKYIDFDILRKIKDKMGIKA